MTNENPPDGRSSPDIEILAAGVLEDGQICPYCQRPINGGDVHTHFEEPDRHLDKSIVPRGVHTS